jgi:hypothetical protein
MKVVTELMAGLCTTADRKRLNLKHQDSTVRPLLFLTSPFVMDRATTHIAITSTDCFFIRQGVRPVLNSFQHADAMPYC